TRILPDRGVTQPVRPECPDPSGSEPRLWASPGRVVFQREDLLDLLGAGLGAAQKHLDCLPDAGHSWVGDGSTGIRSAADPVQDRGQVEQPAPGFEEELIQGTGGGERLHGSSSLSRTMNAAKTRFREDRGPQP